MFKWVLNKLLIIFRYLAVKKLFYLPKGNFSDKPCIGIHVGETLKHSQKSLAQNSLYCIHKISSESYIFLFFKPDQNLGCDLTHLIDDGPYH